jgi:hypothetical protein
VARTTALSSRAARASSLSGVSDLPNSIPSLPFVAMLSRRSRTARRLAAAELFSSWARPAARVLRELSLSRCPAMDWRILTR